MANRIRPCGKLSLRPATLRGDGNPILNEILLSLPAKECDLIFPRLEFVRLKTHQLLHEPGDTIRSAYFCNSGLISILSVFPDGKSVECGLVWSAWFVGLPLIDGFRPSARRSFDQAEACSY